MIGVSWFTWFTFIRSIQPLIIEIEKFNVLSTVGIVFGADASHRLRGAGEL